jgi:hypothetical protein
MIDLAPFSILGALLMSTSALERTLILKEVSCAGCLLFGFVLLAQCVGSSSAVAQTSPWAVSLCEVSDSPAKFDKQTLQLRGQVYLYFEDFSLRSEACPNKWPGIWLAFGGDVATPTMSTANDTVRRPGSAPVVEGVSVSLVKDDKLEQLFALISARRGHDHYYPLYKVSATLTGIFLAGNRKLRRDGNPEWPGYGHMGLFYLFVISRVDAVDAQPPPQLDVSGTITDADGKPVVGVDVFSQTVNCCQSWVSRARSDDAGNFGIRNAGQVVTFLKAGYGPKSLVLETGGKGIQLVLERKPEDDWQIPTCKEGSAEHHFHGLTLTMGIPHGMHSEQVLPRSFIIHRKVRYPMIRLFKGNPAAPYGETASRLFGSGKFAQRNVLNAEGKTIGLDSRGVLENGESWRVVVIPGTETVEYEGTVPETSDIFDHIIDSACLQSDAITH